MIVEQIWGLLELFAMIALSVIGYRANPRAFLCTLTGLIIIFSLAVGGNPVGLLVSGGGWMILDLMLAAAALVAFGVQHIVKKRDRAMGERPMR